MSDRNEALPLDISGKLLLTESETSRMLSICPRTLFALRKAGKISASKIGSRLNSVRTCRTAAEREAAKQEQRQVIDRVQANKVSFGR